MTLVVYVKYLKQIMPARNFPLLISDQLLITKMFLFSSVMNPNDNIVEF